MAIAVIHSSIYHRRKCVDVILHNSTVFEFDLTA